MDAAQRFFQQALETVGCAPERVITDGHDAYPRAIRETLGGDVLHRCSHSQQSRGTGSSRHAHNATTPCAGLEVSPRQHASARTFDEVRQFFRFRTTIGQSVSLAQRRDLFRERLNAFTALIVSV